MAIVPTIFGQFSPKASAPATRLCSALYLRVVLGAKEWTGNNGDRLVKHLLVWV